MRNRYLTLGILVAAAGSGLIAAAAEAALAPPYDRLRQFAAVAEAGDVAEALAPHGLINRIERLDDGVFEVWAGECVVRVTLQAIPPKDGMVGPTSYEATPEAVACK